MAQYRITGKLTRVVIVVVDAEDEDAAREAFHNDEGECESDEHDSAEIDLVEKLGD